MTNDALQASTDCCDQRLLRIAAIYKFASLGKGEEFVMRVQKKVRHRNPFVEMADDSREAALESRLESGLEQGQLLALREVLLRQLPRKFPARRITTIRARVRKIKDSARLQKLIDRILDDLSWEDFWAES